MSLNEDQNQKNIPVQVTGALIFDDAFSSMKEKFAAQMRLIDDEMTKISTNLFLQSHPGPQTGTTTSKGPLNLDFLADSPLVGGEGENKTLNLQFDVSQFDPSEISVTLLNNKLTVSATHQEKTDTSVALREYHREFHFPQGVDPSAIVSSLSKDGVLIVQAPLPAIPKKPSIKA